MNLSSNQFKAILREYDSKRMKNAQKLRLRREEIYDKISSIRKIEQQIINKGLEISKSIMDSPEKRDIFLENLSSELIKLKQQKKELLNKHGYSDNYLDPIYDCELCEDTGYIDNEKCQCFKQALIDAAYEQSNIKNILLKENFSTFSFELYSTEKSEVYGISPRDNIKMIYNQCRRFVDNFDSIQANLILYGNTGRGKTFLCNCIAKELLDKSYSVIYLSAFKLFKLVEAYRFKDNEQEVTYDDIDDIYTCDLLIIDDLGSEVINSFTNSELFNCLNTRLLSKKPTVISTNLDPAGWTKNYSTRIVSRIFGNFATLHVIGDDIRLKKYI